MTVLSPRLVRLGARAGAEEVCCGRRCVVVGTADRPLDASALRDWAHAVVSDLILHIDEINRLNVFPVADSDTGVNMLFTMRAAVVEADLHANSQADAEDVARVAAALAAGAR